MSSATLRVAFHDITLDELEDHIGKLRFAGWGKCSVEFATSSVAANFSTRVELKMYRNLAEQVKEK